LGGWTSLLGLMGLLMNPGTRGGKGGGEGHHCELGRLPGLGGGLDRACDRAGLRPWWKVLRSLALKGRRFDAWAKIEQVVERATAYWNEHKHPFIWGRRRRHRTPRRLGIATPPNVASFSGCTT
jgi:hypothetical protein